MKNIFFIEQMLNGALIFFGVLSNLVALFNSEAKLLAGITLFFLGVFQVVSALFKSVFFLIRKQWPKEILYYWGMVLTFFLLVFLLEHLSLLNWKITLNLPLIIAFYYAFILKRLYGLKQKRSSFLPNVSF